MNPETLKKAALEALLEQTSQRLKSAVESYRSALEHSRSDDMKSEGKYDTRAIEAGYLASAKKQRVEELEGELAALRKMRPLPREKASLGALVAVEEAGKEKLYFLAPCSGTILELEGLKVFVISTTSPLAKEFLGLEPGEAFDFETPKGRKEIIIMDVG